MQRLDGGGLEVFQGGAATVGLGAALVGGPLLHTFADPLAQLGGGGLGEGDRGDLLDLRAARGDQRDDPRDERRRLARARAGLDEEARAELRLDAVSGGLVCRLPLAGHGPSSPLSRSAV